MKKRDQKQQNKINDKVRVSDQPNSSSQPALQVKNSTHNSIEGQKFNSQSLVENDKEPFQNKRQARSQNSVERPSTKNIENHALQQKFSKQNKDIVDNDLTNAKGPDADGQLAEKWSSQSNTTPKAADQDYAIGDNLQTLEDVQAAEGKTSASQKDNAQSHSIPKDRGTGTKHQPSARNNSVNKKTSDSQGKVNSQQVEEKSLIESQIHETQLKFESILREESKTETQPTASSNFDNNADFLSFDDIKDKSKRFKDPNQTKFDRAQLYPWVSDSTLDQKDMHIHLHNEICDFVSWIQPSPEKKAARESLVKKIKKVVKDQYPEAVVMVFGSCATGLNLPSSDIDLLVYNPQVKEQTMISKLSNSLLAQGICKSIEALKYTKVPLIKLQDKNTNIQVDISFNRTNGIYCVKLVKFLLKKYPELKPLILVLKAFLKSRQLNEPYHGGVGSFLLTMLVTSYLQRKYKEGGTDKIDLGKHLVDFFQLYGVTFNYDQVGISIRKEGSYFQKVKRGWFCDEDRMRSRLCVENPQDKDVDVGKPAYNIMKVKRAFNHAYDTLIYNNSNEESLLKLIITSHPKEIKEGE